MGTLDVPIDFTMTKAFEIMTIFSVQLTNCCPEKQKAEPPFLKAARLSSKTRGFPSLPFSRFGFVCYQLNRNLTHLILRHRLAKNKTTKWH
jgi:hypothetical protein